MEIHLLGVSYVDVLVLEAATEEVALGAEVGLFTELRGADELKLGYFATHVDIVRDILHVERVAALRGPAKNEHVNSIDRHSSRGWHPIEGWILYHERLPLLK